MIWQDRLGNVTSGLEEAKFRLKRLESATPHEVKLASATLVQMIVPDAPKNLIGDGAYDSDKLDALGSLLINSSANRTFVDLLAGTELVRQIPAAARRIFGTFWNVTEILKAAKWLKTWWPGTELNRRRQPFQGWYQP